MEWGLYPDYLVESEETSSGDREFALSNASWVFQTLQHIPDNVFAQDLNGRFLVANQALATSCGYANACDLIGKITHDVFQIETATFLESMTARAINGAKPILDHEQNIVYSDGKSIWFKSNHIPLYDDTQRAVGLVCTFRDITELKQVERLMLVQANLFDMVAQSAPLAQICGDIVTVVEDYVADAVAVILLFLPDYTELKTWIAPSFDDGMATCLDSMTGSIAKVAMSATETGEPVIVPDIHIDSRCAHDIGILSKQGVRAIWAVPIVSAEGIPLGVLSLLSRSASTPTTFQSDLLAMAGHMVSTAIERQENVERNKFFASHDSLTRLPNRLMFEESLGAAVQAAGEKQSRVGLAFFDLDNFKLINDSLGHKAGDILLKTVAERAQNNLRAGDIVARVGGDEFVMFMSDLPAESELIEQRFQQIREAISAPTEIDGRMVQITCSMGIAYFPNHAETTASLIGNADVAMYRAKQLGRDCMQVFAPDMLNFADAQLSCLSELREAITRGEFILHYQPQVDIGTGRIFGAEALIRWNHPQLGLLYAGDFISLAEKTGLIVVIGEWVLETACRQNRKWQDEGLPPIVISVNISPRQFHGPNLVAKVSAALQSSGLDPEYLELELTESLIMQEGAALKMLELEALGVKLAIDDFGTGYSSLSALKHFPVSRLKIDRSFIRDISTDEYDQAITSAIIVMAKNLKIQVIAEGIETLEQLCLIQGLGCTEIQGYYFSRAVDPETFEKIVGDVTSPLHDKIAWHGVSDNKLDRVG